MKTTDGILKDSTACNPASSNRSCPICDIPGTGLTPLKYGPPEWPLVRCPNCKLVYLIRTPAISELEDERAWEKTFLGERERRQRAYPALTTLDRLTRARLNIYRRSPQHIIAHLARPGAVLD